MNSKKQSIAPTLPPEDTRPKLDDALIEHTSMMKAAIPVLPLCLAWFCLLCNCFVPGLGMERSGVEVRPRHIDLMRLGWACRNDPVRTVLPVHRGAAILATRRSACPDRIVRHQLHCGRIADVLSAVLSGRLGLVDLVGHDHVARSK